jgi:MYXO-CTERM domain-containing protein
MKSAVLLLLSTVLPLSAATLWSENSQGDLSDDYTAPNTFNLTQGSNFLSVFTSGGDPDLFTVVVPAGFQIEFLNLASYNFDVPGNETFLGFQNGAVLQRDPADFTFAMAGEISWLTYGESQEGRNLFDSISSSPNASAPPLGEGTYAFWINEIEPTPAFSALEFLVTPAPIPEPAVLPLLGLAGLVTLRRRRPN